MSSIFDVSSSSLLLLSLYFTLYQMMQLTCLRFLIPEQSCTFELVIEDKQ